VDTSRMDVHTDLQIDLHMDREVDDSATATSGYGELISERRSGVTPYILAAFCVGFAGICVWPIVMHIIEQGQRGKPIETPFVVVFAGIVLVSLAVAGVLVHGAKKVVRFFERGAAMYQGKKQTASLAYSDVDSITFNVTRQYINGIYAGTAVAIKLKAGDAKVSWAGRHKEKPKGLAITSLGKKFEGEDELDAIKLVIADHVAERWEATLLDGGEIKWCGMTLTADGLIIKKKQPVPLENIAIAMDHGWCSFADLGTQKEIASCNLATENFWPGIFVLARFHDAAQAGSTACEAA
jgi:hypothetical protein